MLGKNFEAGYDPAEGVHMENITVIPAYTPDELITLKDHLLSILKYHEDKLVPQMHEGDIIRVVGNDGLTAVFFQSGEIFLETKDGTFSFVTLTKPDQTLVRIFEAPKESIPFLMQWETILSDLLFAIEQRAKEVKFLMEFSVEPKKPSTKFI